MRQVTPRKRQDIQGTFYGLPYDFRVPTLPKVAKRLYQPGGPLLVPKVFGAGWTLNLAHRGTYWILGASMMVAVVAMLFA